MTNLIHRFIPEHFFAKENRLALRRAEIALKTVFTMVLWGPIVSGFYYWGGFTTGAVAVLSCCMVTLLAPLVLRYTGKMSLAAHFVLGPLFVLLVWLAYLLGGINSPVLSWLIFVPLFAALFRDTSTAVRWMVVVLVSWGVYIGVDMAGYELEPVLGPSIMAILELIELVGLGVSVFVIFLLKDHLQEWLIHKMRERQEELQQARDKAVEASRAKSAFLANMSHELRTPLNAVIGYSEMIKEEIEFMEEDEVEGVEQVTGFVPDLERIRTAGKHLLALINDILDLSKIEAGKMTTHVELFDVAELLDDIGGTIRPLANKNDNTLTIEVADELRYMRSDTTKVRQILFNLLSNACKFTTGGSVVLRAARGADGTQVEFTVEDTGVGMSPEQLDKVFEAFTQADSSTTREFGGTGLGLTITSHFCSLLGGSIAVESTPGEGSTFTVKLSADLDGQADGDAEASTGGDARSQPRLSGGDGEVVLVIDDDPTMRDLLQRVLEREGFQVATAANGSEGLLLAEQLAPDVITLDVMMPSMDGWTLLAKLKEHPELSATPVVMITMVSESKRGYALGADHFLVKPVDREQLLDVLQPYRSADSAAAEAGEAGEVLLVEDDEPTRSLIGRVLAKEGWQIVEAENGQVGLEKLAESDPDLVLLDLMMPKMDGFEFLRHFREDDAYADVPVVVVTAKELTAEDEERLRTGVSEILAKGGRDQDALLDEVRQQVRKVAAGRTRKARKPATV
ncbi:response regulator [Persicimonas caeni]|uniref:histidine kinase n=1 Tax=Persicimonas caeni TaxID=2292766 RepID=A0A4Y6PU19_PERCE|nr:response regulator [Persicimonas caeni]QDG51265.1 response regulator [Persicimonas caeni]QED32486.1 response regulator [Persicimonas caeni]